MSETESTGDRELVFNHGCVDHADRPDIDETELAVRTAIYQTRNAPDESGEFSHTLAELLADIISHKQYTEGHHPVRLTLTEAEVKALHRAHVIATEKTPRLTENHRTLPDPT